LFFGGGFEKQGAEAKVPRVAVWFCALRGVASVLYFSVVGC